jgi:hypothetical protein
MSAFARELTKDASVASAVQAASNYLATPGGKNALKLTGVLAGGMVAGHVGNKVLKDYKRGRGMRLQHEYSFHDGGF